MAAFKTITTHRLAVLLLQFLLGNSYLLLPADPASAAGWTDLYPRVALLSGLLLFTTVSAATILLYVRMGASYKQKQGRGVPYNNNKLSAGWKLRALLLLAIALSAASTLLAVFTFEDGFRYRTGHASVLFCWPAWVLLFIMGVEHGIAAGLLLLAAYQD